MNSSFSLVLGLARKCGSLNRGLRSKSSGIRASESLRSSLERLIEG